MATGVGTADEAVVLATPGSTTLWTASDLAALTRHAGNTIPPFVLDSNARVPGFDLWDMWPVEHADGSLPRFDGAAHECGQRPRYRYRRGTRFDGA